MSNLTLVIAWDREYRGPLAIRLAADLRHARRIVEDLQREYVCSRVSILKEIGVSITPSHPDAPNYGERFLGEDGEWEAEWIQEREDAMGAQREEERERKGGW